MDPAEYLDPNEVEANLAKYDAMLDLLAPVPPAYMSIVEVDPTDVPSELRYLIPLARAFGIGDDIHREKVIAATPYETLIALKHLIDEAEEVIQTWLGSPAAMSKLSRAYVAFTNLTIVADGVRPRDIGGR